MKRLYLRVETEEGGYPFHPDKRVYATLARLTVWTWAWNEARRMQWEEPR